MDNLSFENLSQLLNDLGIMTHPMSNEQKVCIEYPNINIENKLLDNENDILNQDENENDFSPEKSQNKSSHNDEYTLNLSKNKTYTINPIKLYNEFNKNIPYKIEEFKNSLKIFTSIFNCFNEDLFKWNLEDFNLYNDENKVEMLIINQENFTSIKSDDSIKELYKKHFSIHSYNEEGEMMELVPNTNSDEINEINNHHISKDDFEDDFDSSIKVTNIIDNNNKLTINENSNNTDNQNLYCYEKDRIFRNIYLLMNYFNLMNSFSIDEFSLDNILKNITLLNSHIINDYKILLLICFNIYIQINIYLNKVSVNNFLKINNNNNDNKSMNNYFPNIFYIDYQNKEIAKEDNELVKEEIILLNIIYVKIK